MLNLFSLLAFENLDPMNWEVIKPALQFLWKGLLAIFIVIALIIIAVSITKYCIAKCAEWKEQREREKEEQEQNENAS